MSTVGMVGRNQLSTRHMTMRHSILTRIGVYGWLFLLLVPETYAQSPTDPNWTRALAWHPDGSQIAIGTQYGSIQLVNMDGQITTILQTDTGFPIFSLAWSPDGHYLSSGGGDRQTVIWNAVTGEPSEVYQNLGRVSGMMWHPNSEYLAVATADDRPANVVVLNVVTGERVFETLASEAFSAAWNPDGDLLAIGKYGEIQIWNPFMGTGQLKRIISTYPPNILSLGWSPDGTRLASTQTITAELSVANIWAVDTGRLVVSYEAHSDVIRSISWSPNGIYLATASNDGTIQIWDSSSGQTIQTLQENTKLLAVDWSPDGTKLAYGIEEGIAKIISAPGSSSCIPAEPPTTTVAEGCPAEPDQSDGSGAETVTPTAPAP